MVGFVEGYEEADQEMNRVVGERGRIVGCGRRVRESEKRKGGNTYRGLFRSFRRFGSERGMRAEAWSLKGGITAFDAELSALVRGIELCLLSVTLGATFNIFTDSQAAMLRLRDDRPGPGQGMAVRGIKMAREAIRRGASITIRWVPGHAGVPGNEIADQWAVDAAKREHRSRARGAAGEAPIVASQCVSQAFLKTVLKRRAVTRWREEIAKKSRSRRPYYIPGEGVVPKIPVGLQRVPKELASRFFQLSSGHEMIAPFLKEKFGWTDSDSCWWCSGGRQSREHLFKECKTWREEIRTLWKEVGEASGSNKSGESGCRYKGKKGFCFGIEGDLSAQEIVRWGDCWQTRVFRRPC